MPNTMTREIHGSQSAVLSNSRGLLAGYSVRETDGQRAVIRFRDGNMDNSTILLTISLTALESARDWFMPTGIAYTYGVYCEVVSGTVEGSIQVVTGAGQ